MTVNIEELTEYCQSLSHVFTEILWGNTLVFKVGGKIFCLAALDEGLKINLKCDPDEALELRERFRCVLPGYHMNKRHWNTIVMDGTVSDNMIRMLIESSYRLVVQKLSGAEKVRLGFWKIEKDDNKQLYNG